VSLFTGFGVVNEFLVQQVEFGIVFQTHMSSFCKIIQLSVPISPKWILSSQNCIYISCFPSVKKTLVEGKGEVPVLNQAP
jgi:hypothetical protein